MASRLVDRLRAARRRHFVGREEGKALFQSVLTAVELPFFVLYIHGPGGLGKTSLLHELLHLARQSDVTTLYLDGRNIEPTPQQFQQSLRAGLDLENELSIADALAAATARQRHIVLLDTYEELMALDDWLRDQFLPQMPENLFFVLAGREEPTHAWRSDPGWHTLLRTLPLRNLSLEESVAYLSRRGVPADQVETVIRFTHGYPLALSLVSDVFDQTADFHFRPDDAIDIISTLVAQLLDEVPDAVHRATLEVACLVRGTTEALLTEMLQVDDAHHLFQWLRSLSFVDSGPRGLFPHDMAREVLQSDLRWRNPDWYTELHHRARRYYTARFQQTQGQEQQRALFDLIYLHRENAMVKSLFEWQTAASVLPDRALPADFPLLQTMVERLEGPHSAQLAAYWIGRQPENLLVIRDRQGEPVGFLLAVALQTVTPADQAVDPAIRAARSYVDRRAPLRAGETATCFRFWMGAGSYQSVSPIQTLIFTSMVRHYLVTPKLAFTFLPCADPDFWSLGFAYADLTRLPEVDYTIDGRQYGVYGHDWRVTPPIAWLTLMGERELGGPLRENAPTPTPTLIVLSEEDFGAAVKETLEQLHRPDRLLSNPLVRSRLVATRPARETDAGAALQELVRTAVDALRHTPKDLKLHRALYHTYIQPAPTQERAAELLDLPFSTYRRHLKAGIERVVEQLWQQEIESTDI